VNDRAGKQTAGTQKNKDMEENILSCEKAFGRRLCHWNTTETEIAFPPVTKNNSPITRLFTMATFVR
jgi:hypothetical protein